MLKFQILVRRKNDRFDLKAIKVINRILYIKNSSYLSNINLSRYAYMNRWRKKINVRFNESLRILKKNFALFFLHFNCVDLSFTAFFFSVTYIYIYFFHLHYLSRTARRKRKRGHIKIRNVSICRNNLAIICLVSRFFFWLLILLYLCI